MNSISRLFVILFLILSSQAAFAGWFANADFTSCPRKYMPRTSGREGPFATESDCNARVEKAKRESPDVCTRYTCVNEGGTASGGTTAPPAAGHEMDPHIEKAIAAGLNGQISSGDAMGLVGMGILGNALLAPRAAPTAEQLAAQREYERQQIAAEQERQRRIKEHNDQMDSEAAGTLALLGPGSASTSDEDLLKPSVAAAPPEKKFNCEESAALADRLEKEGLKRLDINMGKTKKVIKQAEEGKGAADKELAVIAGEAVGGQLADKFKDFATSHKKILEMEKHLQKLTADRSVSNADTAKLKAWLDAGIDTGQAVMDSYEVLKKSKDVKLNDIQGEATREKMLAKLAEFNEKFMNETGAWELAGDHLSGALGPAGKVAFKTAVLGIKVSANRGAKMISENDLNEYKYHLGNMMKTRSEMAQQIKVLRKRLKDECSKTS